jgi:prefoldin subunit 5
MEKDITLIKLAIEGMVNKIDRIDDGLGALDKKFDKLDAKIDTVDQKLSAKIEAVDQKLSGRIDAVDQKLSGKIEALDSKMMEGFTAFDRKTDIIYEELCERIGTMA